MKLFFCDICNESIPLQDIKDNRALTIKGKIFCRVCNPVNDVPASEPTGGSGTAAKPDSARASGGSLAVLFVGLLAALGASGYLIYERAFGGAETSALIARRFDTMEDGLRDTKQNVSMIAGNVEGLNGLRAFPKEVEKLQEDVARTRGEIETIGAGLASAEKNLNTVGNLRERLDAVVLRQDEFARGLGRLEGVLAQLQGQLKEVADRPPVIVTPEPMAGKIPDGESESPALDDRLLTLIEKLGSSDAMVRWEAVDQIRAEKEKALIPHVIKLLSDRDTFVRAQAIYALGELKATKAVPELIKLLRDDEQMIREEALTALVEVTGQNIKFDVNSKNEREKGIKRWDEWLVKNRDSL